ncbi:hypothetical protein F4680DRAFT_471221 [Xylaria scruposa]|nr:hypothetical protein F4680DRAFT_471221 [Xylaria scruposa]
MSTIIFQKYLEGMNGQPLEKKPEPQSASVLLPHQRTSPIKKAVPYQDSTGQTPNNIRNGQVVHATPCKDVPALVSKSSMTNELLSSNEQSPENNRGLAASRWNDQSCQSTPMNKTGCLATPPHRARKQQRGVVETLVATSSNQRVDKNTHRTPVQKFLSLVSDEAVAQNSILNTSDRRNGSFYSPRRDDVNGVPDNESNDAKSQTWDSSHQPSAVLPIVLASTANPEANTEAAPLSPKVGAQRVEKCDTIHDPRGRWPIELSVGDQVKQDMLGQDQESLDEVSSSTKGQDAIPQHATSFINTWIMGAHEVSTNFLSQNINGHEDCDVDTFSGVLMSPIEHPRTKTNGLMSCSQAEKTSSSFMKEFLAKTALKQKTQRSPEKELRVTAGASEAETRPMVTENSNLNEVQIPCHLRPAMESDIQLIAAIYNREVSEGYRAMDIKPIKPNDFHTVYERCQVERMPFVVAVEGYHGVTDQKIIGFALITELSHGIAGSLETLSSRGGKLLVIVEPQYRRKKVGTALIDLITTNCTGWYNSKCGYQFVNYTHDWISNEFGRSPRRWWYLEMEVMILSGDNEETTRKGKEFQWIWNFLEAKFGMMLKHYDENCCYEPRQMKWLDKLTFRRVCRNPRK